MLQVKKEFSPVAFISPAASEVKFKERKTIPLAKAMHTVLICCKFSLSHRLNKSASTAFRYLAR